MRPAGPRGPGRAGTAMTSDRIAFVCSCEDSMVLDGRALARGCAARGTELRTAEQLCRSQLDRFLAAIGTGRPVTVGCTQEAPLFAEEAAAAGAAAPLAFVNLRETGRLGEGRPRRPGRRWPGCWPPPPSRCRTPRWCRCAARA